MAVLKSDLSQRVGGAAFEQFDSHVYVQFHDGGLTPELLDTLPTWKLLARLLLSWDVLDDAGQLLMPPPDLSDDERVAAWEAILYRLPLSFLYLVEKQMLAAVRSGQSLQPTPQPQTTLTA